MKYSLDELAWFNRCLFVSDFISDINKAGYDENLSKLIELELTTKVQEGYRLNIVDIYQAYIQDKEFITAVENVLFKFFNKEK